MRQPIKRSPQSLDDALTTYVEIADDNIEAAEAYLNAIDERLDRLQDHPELGQSVPFAKTQLSGLRWIRVSSTFRGYLLFYLPTNTGIHVLRILHRSRDIESLFSED